MLEFVRQNFLLYSFPVSFISFAVICSLSSDSASRLCSSAHNIALIVRYLSPALHFYLFSFTLLIMLSKYEINSISDKLQTYVKTFLVAVDSEVCMDIFYKHFSFQFFNLRLRQANFCTNATFPFCLQWDPSQGTAAISGGNLSNQENNPADVRQRLKW
jgi:hypothetical protein